MRRVLLISTRKELIRLATRALSEQGHELVTCERTGDVLELVCKEGPDVVIHDLLGSKVSLNDLARDIRSNESLRDIRLLVLGDEKTLGEVDFSVGVDEFLLEPLRAQELVSRLRLMEWKDHGVKRNNVLVSGDLSLDSETFEVFAKTRKVILTYREYELLRFLMSHPGKVFRRSVLLNRVWGFDYFGGERTVDVHVRRLRQKLGTQAGAKIETVRGAGYRFRDKGQKSRES